MTKPKATKDAGYEPRYDIPKYTHSPNWKEDLKHGKKGEQIVKQFLEAVDNGSFEVKFDRYRNGRMAVETEQNPRGKGWKPSGLSVTEADWWVYMFSPTGFVMVSTNRLRKYIKVHGASLERRDFAPMSQNPARGFLLYPEHVHELLNSSEFDDD